MFSKQLKNLQSNLLIGGFISIIYSSFAWGLSTGGEEVPEAARPEDPKAQKQHALKTQKFPEAARPESFAPHALKGQKLLAQGNALGNYGRKPVAL